jgi:hypothetical protein
VEEHGGDLGVREPAYSGARGTIAVLDERGPTRFRIALAG